MTSSILHRVRCPHCSEQETRVRESRPADEGGSVRRRRECSSCSHRFTTYERYERGPLYIRKRGGDRQAFDREKLRGGLLRAAHKRPIEDRAIDGIVDRIVAEIEKAGGELEASRVGEMCLEGLHALDRVAYLQFAAVYKQLNVEEVRAELASMSEVPEVPVFAGSHSDGSVRSSSDPA